QVPLATLFFDAASLSATSCSVSVARSPMFTGRCRGMFTLPGQFPCRSGSPHGVLGAVNAFAGAGFGLAAAGAGAGVEDCPETEGPASSIMYARYCVFIVGLL